MRDIQRFLWGAIPAAIVFSCFLPYRKRTLQAMRLQSSTLRETALILFVMTISGICALKLWPVSYQEPTSGLWGDIELLIDRPAWDTMLNLVPFSMFIDYVESWTVYGSSDLLSIIKNILGNIFLFMPLGLLPALLFREVTWKHALLIGFAMSLLTEVGQYFIMRNASVDDLMINTFGALFGYLIYKLLHRHSSQFTEMLQCHELKETSP